MSTRWTILPKTSKRIILKEPTLIEGLPGIGNVGKIALDYIIEDLKAEKIFEITSNTFPHSVFVTEDNLIELPSIGIYHKRIRGKDFLFMAGDIQPTDEVASYDFAEFVLDYATKADVKKIVTLGGIALNRVPSKPKVFCTGNDRALIQEMVKQTGVSNALYGIIGPIMGVSGLLLGLSVQKKIPAVTLLAETLGHPMYLGMEGARALLFVLEKRFALGVNLKGFDKEVKQMEEEMRRKTQEIDEVQKTSRKRKKGMQHETSYIG